MNNNTVKMIIEHHSRKKDHLIPVSRTRIIQRKNKPIDDAINREIEDLKEKLDFEIQDKINTNKMLCDELDINNKVEKENRLLKKQIRELNSKKMEEIKEEMNSIEEIQPEVKQIVRKLPIKPVVKAKPILLKVKEVKNEKKKEEKK